MYVASPDHYDVPLTLWKVYMPLGGLRGHREGAEALWAWFTENFDVLAKKFPAALTMLGTLVSLCSNNFTTHAQAQEVADFFKNKDTKGFDRSLAQSLDAIAAKASWVERDHEDVKEWLKASGYLDADKSKL